jgi:hypothetical protein
MKGDALGSCSCDWGCPCNFDAPPTKGWCEGGYVFHINEGHLDDTSLVGLTVGFLAHSPAALHLGNVTGYLLVDEKATADQRAALGRIFGGELGGPFAVLASLLVKLIGPDYVPVEWKFDGPNSYARFGDRVEMGLKMIENPVTGEKSGFTLKMTNGLLTNEAELMASSVFSVNHPELSYNHSGQYGETFRFDYSGEG